MKQTWCEKWGWLDIELEHRQCNEHESIEIWWAKQLINIWLIRWKNNYRDF